MTVKELIKVLKLYKSDSTILISSDAELNCLRKDMQVAYLGENNSVCVIYGLDGSETEDY